VTRAFAYSLIGFGIVLILVSVFGCAHTEWCEQHRDRNQRSACFGNELPGEPCPPADLCTLIPQQSWDQENLKRNDAGCPTAIYTAPNGELQLCPPM
jgi:hypothetical protein